MNIKNALGQRQEMAARKGQREVEIASEMYQLIVNSKIMKKGNRGRAVHLLSIGAKKRR
jgi:hypothetical protein